MKSDYKYIHSLLLVRKVLINLSIITFLAQFFIDPSIENEICNFMALVTFIVTSIIVIHPRNKSIGAALTGTVVFLAVTANSLAPMLGTILEGHSLIYTLLQPVETFSHRVVFAIAILSAHLLTGIKSRVSVSIFSRVSSWASTLKTNSLLPPSGVWALGAIGLVMVLVKYLPLPIELIKTADGFSFLLQAPFLLLLPPYYNNVKNNGLIAKLSVVFVLQVILSIASNSRAGIIGPIGVVGGGWLVTLLMGLTVVDLKFIRRATVGGVIAILMIGQLGDLSTAILIERAYRSSRGPAEQITATIDRFFDKEALANYRLNEILVNAEATSDEVWQENYIQNAFLRRFVQIKYDDNLFNRVLNYGDYAKDILREKTLDKLFALLPQPVLNSLEINIDKVEVNSYSIGDLMEVLSGGGSLGSFRNASIPAHAYAIFGWWYPLILVFVYYMLFLISQGLVSKRNTRTNIYRGISTLGLLFAFKLFNEASFNSIINVVSILLRGIWQIAIFYYFSIILLNKFGIKVYEPSINNTQIRSKKSLITTN